MRYSSGRKHEQDATSQTHDTSLNMKNRQARSSSAWELCQQMIEGSLEVKLPPLWTHGKAQPGRKSEERGSEREKVRREKMQVREKVGKSRNSLFFQ